MTSNPCFKPHPVAAIACAGLLAGCGLLRSVGEAPGRIANAALPGDSKKKPPADALLGDLIRYADLIVFRVEQATREFERTAATPEAELQASRWRLDAIRWSTQFATGPNPISSLLDMLVLATTFRWLQEDYWIPEVWGEPVRPLSLALLATERDGWLLLERHLTPAHVAEARTLLADWRGDHPKLVREHLLEFPSFTALIEEQSSTGKSDSSLLGLVGLDPLSGLEPAALQIEQTRQFAQRALFFAQRAPRLVGAEVEVRTLHVRGSKEVVQVLADTERITTSLEGFAATAAGLPEVLRTEREAAVKQIADEIEAQRAGLVRDLEESRAPLESLLRESRTTLEAGKGMSQELTTTLRTLDTFLGRFDKPGDATAPAGAPAPAGKPFDIVEYGTAAERIGQAVGELNTLVATLDKRLPEARQLLDEAAERGERTVDHALLRVLQVGLILIGAAGVVVLLVRRFGPASQRRAS